MGFHGDAECWFCFVERNCHEFEFTKEYVYICCKCAEDHAKDHADFLERSAKVFSYEMECANCKKERHCLYEVRTCFQKEK